MPVGIRHNYAKLEAMIMCWIQLKWQIARRLDLTFDVYFVLELVLSADTE